VYYKPWTVKEFLCSADKKIYTCDAFNKDWIWLDAKKDVNFSSFASVDHGLAHGVSSIDELRDDHVGGSNSGQEEEGGYYGLEQVMNFAKHHAAFKTVKSFFYAPS
jgi:hypothetical protein